MNQPSTSPQRGRASARRCAVLSAAIVLGTIVPSATARASTDTQNCLASIFSATGKFSQCRYKAEAKFLKTLDRQEAFAASSKCAEKLRSSITRAYEKFGSACPDLASPAQAALRVVPTTPVAENTLAAIVSALLFGQEWIQQQFLSVVSDPEPETFLMLPGLASVTAGSEVAGIDVTPSRVPLCTTEAGGTASFTVVLTRQPIGPVTIPFASSDLTEGLLSTASLTFTSANWSTPQTVTVTGVDDPQIDGSAVYRILPGPALSADLEYQGLLVNGVPIANLDDDFAGITVFPQAGLVTTEVGGTDSFQVVLNTEPVAPVSIGISSSNAAEGKAMPAVLTFTTASWSTPQTVTVTGVDDGQDDGDQAYTIITAPAQGDVAYAGLDAADVSVLNRDVSCGDGVRVNPEVCDDGNVASGDGCNSSCTSVEPGYACPPAGGACTLVVACGTSSSCIFVTSGTSTGDLGGVAGADAACNLHASSAGLPGTYVAWLSTSTADAIDRIVTNGPYAKVSGEVVASSLAELTDGSLDSPIDEDEYGTVVPLREAWTGTGATGLGSGSTCADWTDGSASQLGTVGQNEATSSSWTDVFVQFCDHTVSLYCIQQ